VTASTQDRPALDEARLTAAIRSAHLPSLLMVLFQLTGDRKWLTDPYRPTPARGLDDHPTGGFSEELQEQIREAAVEAVSAWAGGRPAAVPRPTHALLGEMASWCFADEVPEEYQEMMAAQMGFADHVDTVAPVADQERALRTDFSVAIIGAGISGMYTALRLRELGVPYVILERADGVGGVWRANTYPGAGVDTPSHLYSFPFFHHEWSVYFARQHEVLEYLRDFADAFDLLPDIRFGTEVQAATWDDREQCWTVTVSGPDGARSELTVNAIISAVGLFKEPAIPDLPGLESFTGPIFHSANWPKDLDLSGKRLAVVGTGASAMQVVPATADVAGHIDVFQRTPQWIARSRTTSTRCRRTCTGCSSTCPITGAGIGSGWAGHSTTRRTRRCSWTRSGSTSTAPPTGSTTGTGDSSPSTSRRSSPTAPICSPSPCRPTPRTASGC